MATANELVERVAQLGERDMAMMAAFVGACETEAHRETRDSIQHPLLDAKPDDPATWTPEMAAFVEQQNACHVDTGEIESADRFRRTLVNEAIHKVCLPKWALAYCLYEAIKPLLEDNPLAAELFRAHDATFEDLAYSLVYAAQDVTAAADKILPSLDFDGYVNALAEAALASKAESEAGE